MSAATGVCAVRIAMGLALGATIVVASVGCYPARRDPTIVSARDARIEALGPVWQRYSAADRELLRTGRMRPGLDELGLYVAWGQPAFYWNTKLNGRQCRVLLYPAEDLGKIGTAVYSCDGTVMTLARVEPQLPCWRAAGLAPRIAERAAYFDQLPIETQWQLVVGQLKRGQSSEDVYVAFGRPYNVGAEAREDGTNAESQVFLDSTGDAYGLYVTLVSGHVVGWRIPPDRQLTPEAQQRNLRAVEQRLTTQLSAMEARSMERHREEVSLLNAIQAQGDALVQGVSQSALQRVPAVADVNNGVGGDSAGNSGSVGDTQRPEPDGESTLTLNGCTYHGRTGTPFGQSCDDSGNGCPDAYSCALTLGHSGFCVPRDQPCGH